MYKSFTQVHFDGPFSMSCASESKGWGKSIRLLIAPAKLGSKMCPTCDSTSICTTEYILFECAGVKSQLT